MGSELQDVNVVNYTYICICAPLPSTIECVNVLVIVFCPLRQAKGTYGKDFFTAIKKTKKGDQHISDFHWTVGVALAAERAKGNDSEYKTWIDSLPQRCPNPWCAPDIEELARIPYNAGWFP